MACARVAAGVTASTEQGREQQASLKLQLDSQRLAHVQEELEEHKAERLADSLQKRIQVCIYVCARVCVCVLVRIGCWSQLGLVSLAILLFCVKRLAPSLAPPCACPWAALGRHACRAALCRYPTGDTCARTRLAKLV